MKRSLNYIINFLAVLVFVAGLGLVYTQMPRVSGVGISWIRTAKYEDSPQFADKFNTDIGRVKELALLKNAFEEAETVSTDRIVVGAETDNGHKDYSLGEIISIAQKFGCTMDPVTHQISIETENDTGMQNYDVRVRYKYYDPDFFQRQPAGPSVGATTIRELSFEVMRVLAEYYELRASLQDSPGNFCYSMRYPDQNGEYVDLMNTGKTEDEILSLGKFIIVDRENARMESNVSPVPGNAFENERYVTESPAEDEYLLIAGVDTYYPYQDSYRAANNEFQGMKRSAVLGCILLLCGAVAALISVIPLIRYTGPDSEALLSRGRLGDRIPIEVFAAGCAAAVFVVYKLLKISIFRIVWLLAYGEQLLFWQNVMKGVLVYYGILLIAQSARRAEIRGTLYQESLCGRVINGFRSYFESGRGAGRIFLPFVLYTLMNLLAAAGAVLLLLRGTFRYSRAAAVVLLAILALADLLLLLRLAAKRRQRNELDRAIGRISQGELGMEIDEEGYQGIELETAQNINHITSGLRTALHEQVKAERLKADLITNVSHDIRTPLTSIINYVDLLKRAHIKDEKAAEYIEILDRKSERLKKLTEDLLEASKASSGNVRLEMQKIDLVALAKQAAGEFTEKLEKRSLELCLSTPETPVYILADGRHLWRVLENLYNNAAKYTMEGTRIYADVLQSDGSCRFVLKNISQNKLNISPEELTERFVRGDVSRSTEGSGLGLSIAQSLTKLMGGELIIEIDGDLYKAIVKFDQYEEQAEHENQTY